MLWFLDCMLYMEFFFIEKNGSYVSVMQQCVSHTLLSIQTVFFSFNKPGSGKEPLNCLHCLLALLWQSYLDSNILFIVRLKQMIKKHSHAFGYFETLYCHLVLLLDHFILMCWKRTLPRFWGFLYLLVYILHFVLL